VGKIALAPPRSNSPAIPPDSSAHTEHVQRLQDCPSVRATGMSEEKDTGSAAETGPFYVLLP
jgi:hypothetical protein